MKPYAFQGLSVEGSFFLKDVFMPRVNSFAFAFDSIKEFSVFSSRMDRVAMKGFSMERCGEFSVLGSSRWVKQIKLL